MWIHFYTYTEDRESTYIMKEVVDGEERERERVYEAGMGNEVVSKLKRENKYFF